MTEIREARVGLTPALSRFVLQWGNLGGDWGVNRSVAQIHALLFVSENPLSAEEIADTLGMARSNVSTSLRDLVQWGIVRRAAVFGDRRDFFEAECDVWEMLARIAAVRKARELDPATAALAACLEDARRDPMTPPATLRRLDELHDLATTLNEWWAQMRAVPKSQLMPLIRLGVKVVEVLKPFAKATKPKGEKP